MNTGQDLDRLVAEKVMGWKPMVQIRCGDNASCCENAMIPAYSTDIACAWMVVEHLKKTKKVYLDLIQTDDGYMCGHDFGGYVNVNSGIVDLSLDNIGIGDTAPLAICRAALYVLESH